MTRDPEVVKFITTTGFSEFHRGEDFVRLSRSFFGQGILIADGAHAKWVRAVRKASLYPQHSSTLCRYEYSFVRMLAPSSVRAGILIVTSAQPIFDDLRTTLI